MEACAIGVFLALLPFARWHCAQASGPTYSARAGVPFVGHQEARWTRSAVAIGAPLDDVTWDQAKGMIPSHAISKSNLGVQSFKRISAIVQVCV
jgi:hypothetical protein